MSNPDDFLPSRPYYDAKTQAPASRPRGSGGFNWNYVFVFAAIVGIVGALAWMTQNMAVWKSTATDTGADQAGPATRVLSFNRTVAAWKKEDEGASDYLRPFERGMEGHYDFAFENIANQPATLGVTRVGCDCMAIKVCVLPREKWQALRQHLDETPEIELPLDDAGTSWVSMKPDPKNGVALPADAVGLIRIAWKNNRAPGQLLNLNLTLWTKCGEETATQSEQLRVAVVTVPPLESLSDKESIGVLGINGSREVHFDLWSMTRKKLDAGLATQYDESPLIQVETRPLSQDELKHIGDVLLAREVAKGELDAGKKQAPVILSGVRCTVTVYENKGNKRLDQGPFYRQLKYILDGVPLDEPGPVISGRVKGDVDIGNDEDAGRVQLRQFAASEGTTRRISVRSTGGLKLAVEKVHPSQLVARLHHDQERSTDLQGLWSLEVEVPPGAVQGTLPAGSGVTLRILGDTPRFVRIPISGSAISN